jgi:hypothetical protein
MRALVLALAALLLVPAVASAKTRNIDVPKKLKSLLVVARDKTDVPILLPQKYRTDAKKLVPSGSFARKRYKFSLSAIRGCGGATACFIADFSAKRGGHPHYQRKVTLTGGRTGYFKPLTCGASCSPPVIEWVEDDVLYWIQADAGNGRQEKKRLVGMANSALEHGAR